MLILIIYRSRDRWFRRRLWELDLRLEKPNVSETQCGSASILEQSKKDMPNQNFIDWISSEKTVAIAMRTTTPILAIHQKIYPKNTRSPACWDDWTQTLSIANTNSWQEPSWKASEISTTHVRSFASKTAFLLPQGATGAQSILSLESWVGIEGIYMAYISKKGTDGLNQRTCVFVVNQSTNCITLQNIICFWLNLGLWISWTRSLILENLRWLFSVWLSISFTLPCNTLYGKTTKLLTGWEVIRRTGSGFYWNCKGQSSFNQL